MTRTKPTSKGQWFYDFEEESFFLRIPLDLEETTECWEYSGGGGDV